MHLDDVATVALETEARDGTRKLLLRLSDGLEVETVILPPLPATGRATAANARARTTLCISSQVGCRQGCVFCATGRMGLLRNLTTDEILSGLNFSVFPSRYFPSFAGNLARQLLVYKLAMRLLRRPAGSPTQPKELL